MSNVKTNPSLKKIAATLRRRVTQGNLSAMCDLGMWLQEGFQDRKRRSIVQSDPCDYFCRAEL
jgi:hypothetical protein